jgi:hypothetical protein
MVPRATSGPVDEPVVETVVLVGQGSWDSRRPLLYEGRSVTVLVTSRRARRPGASDVTFTVVPSTGGPASLESLAVSLTGSEASRLGRLDPRGRCVIRDVPDARYALRLRPATEPERPDEHSTRS